MSKHTQSSLRAANLARQAEWDPDDSITLAYRGNELAGEIGEACNVIKKLERERLGIRGSRATKAQLAEELADAVICLDLIAMQAGIDLDAAVRDKFNATSEKYGLQTRLAASADAFTIDPLIDPKLARLLSRAKSAWLRDPQQMRITFWRALSEEAGDETILQAFE